MLTRLFQHLGWADERAYEALAAMPPSAERRRAEAIYAHIAAAEHIWLARIEGRPPTHAVWPELNLSAAKDLSAATAERLRALVDVLTGTDLTREVSYRNSTGQEFRSRLDDILAHVALHGSHQRGQLAPLARQAAGQPANTDYITFVRGVPAPSPDHACGRTGDSAECKDGHQ
jgi:uncharacterized damage-inducible protein DinB